MLLRRMKNFNLVDVKSLKKLESGYGCQGDEFFQGVGHLGFYFIFFLFFKKFKILKDFKFKKFRSSTPCPQSDKLHFLAHFFVLFMIIIFHNEFESDPGKRQKRHQHRLVLQDILNIC